MKNYLFLIVLAIACKPVEQQPLTEVTTVENATIYIGNGEKLEIGSIVIENGKITCVGECDTPDGANRIDAKGKFITPGLVDAHVHFFQTGFFDSRPDAMDLRELFPTETVYGYQAANPERYYYSYLNSGVTAVYDVGGMPWSIGLQKSAENNQNAPHVAAAGTLITPAPEDLISIFNNATEKVMVNLSSAEIGKEVVEYNTARGSTGIKVWGIQLGDEDFMANLKIVAKAVQDAENTLIIHSTPLDQAKEALRLGAKLLVHSVEDQVVDLEFITLAKENDVYYNPTLIVSRGYMNATNAVLGEVFDFQDPNLVVDEKTSDMINRAPEYAYLVDTARLRSQIPRRIQRLAFGDSVMAINLKKIYESGIKIVVGTDAGNPGTLHGVSIFNEMEAMQKAGISAEDMIVIATKNGAEIMDRGEDFGTLEVGKIANLIILDKDPGEDITNMRSLTKVMRGGYLHSVKK